MKRIAFALMCFAGSVRAEPYAALIEPLEVEAFHSVEVRNGVDLVVRAGDELSAVVDYTDGDIDQFKLSQFGDWLRLDRNKRWLIWTNGRQDAFTALLDMPEVRELKALSGAEIRAYLGIQKQFRAEAENGTITVSVDTPNLRLRGNDNAVITVDGTCDRLTMLARPTSTIDLTALDCDSIVIFGDKTRVALPSGANVVEKHAGDT